MKNGKKEWRMEMGTENEDWTKEWRLEIEMEMGMRDADCGIRTRKGMNMKIGMKSEDWNKEWKIMMGMKTNKEIRHVWIG